MPQAKHFLRRMMWTIIFSVSSFRISLKRQRSSTCRWLSREKDVHPLAIVARWLPSRSSVCHLLFFPSRWSTKVIIFFFPWCPVKYCFSRYLDTYFLPKVCSGRMLVTQMQIYTRENFRPRGRWSGETDRPLHKNILLPSFWTYEVGWLAETNTGIVHNRDVDGQFRFNSMDFLPYFLLLRIC